MPDDTLGIGKHKMNEVCNCLPLHKLVLFEEHVEINVAELVEMIHYFR